MEQMSDTPVMTIADYVTALKRWWWALLFMPLIAGASAYWLSSRQQPEYNASATLFVSHTSSSQSNVTAASRLAQTYRELITSRPVLERAIAELNLNRSVQDIAGQVTTSIVRDTQVLKIVVTDRDPQVAADLANGLGRAFVVWISEQQALTTSGYESRQALDGAIEEAKSQIQQTQVDLAALRDKPGTRTTEEQRQLATWETNLIQFQERYKSLLDVQQRVDFSSQDRVILTMPAEPSRVPESPVPQRDGVLAFVLASVLTLASILLFERTFGRIHSPALINRRLGVPVLGAIPRLRRKQVIEVAHAPQSSASASLQALRTRLLLAAPNRHLGTFALTSSDSSEGKSLIVASTLR